jgi:proteasome accessory factor B
MYFRESELLSDVLWHGDDALILSPQSARDAAIASLEVVVKLHG